MNFAFTLPAPTTGIINLSVEPDSPQSRVASVFVNIIFPSMVSLLPMSETAAPSSFTQSIVARISFESSTGSITLTP